jgi:plasmid maintenance system antidote protein VapI
MTKVLFLASFIAISTSVFAQNKASGNADALKAAKHRIAQLIENTAKNITAKGPLGWLDVFENSPDFYMANDSAIAFKDYRAADRFIRDTLVKNLQHIKLQFSNVRITALSAESGTVGAVFNEELTVTDDKVIPVSGYFTATAQYTTAGWKILNLHWSIKK